MQTSENDSGKRKTVDLNQIIFLLLDKAAADPEPSYFDFAKYHDHVIMAEIKKYSSDIRKTDFSGMDSQQKEAVIESMAAGLFDSIAAANMDYLRHGFKTGAKLLAELII